MPAESMFPWSLAKPLFLLLLCQNSFWIPVVPDCALAKKSQPLNRCDLFLLLCLPPCLSSSATKWAWHDTLRTVQMVIFCYAERRRSARQAGMDQSPLNQQNILSSDADKWLPLAIRIMTCSKVSQKDHICFCGSHLQRLGTFCMKQTAARELHFLQIWGSWMAPWCNMPYCCTSLPPPNRSHTFLCVLLIFQLTNAPLYFAVALNFQSPGLPMDLNDGRFQDNGGCGYVLKPAVLMSRERSFDPSCSQRGVPPTHLLLKVLLPFGNTQPTHPRWMKE